MRSPLRFLIVFRIVCYICAAYFLVMGLSLMIFPEFLSKIAGPQDPVILGLLRGAGGSIVPYTLIYVFVAVSPFKLRWAIIVIGTANIVAIVLDFLSVYLGEYTFSYAMFDVPIEFVSVLMMILFLVKFSGQNQKVELIND